MPVLQKYYKVLQKYYFYITEYCRLLYAEIYKGRKPKFSPFTVLILTVLDCALGVHSASNQHNERRYEFYWGYKSHVLVDCISGLPLYELTTPSNIADSAVAAEILAAADQTVSLKECAFLADKGYDAKIIYNTVKSVYEGEAFIPTRQVETRSKLFCIDRLIPFGFI